MATTVLTNDVIGARDHVVPSTSGTLNALNDAIGEASNFDPIQSVSVQVSGTFVGTAIFEVSNDKVNWLAKNLYSPSGATFSSITGVGLWSGDLGARYFRVRVSAYTSGSFAVSVYGTSQSVVSTVSSTTVSNTMFGTTAGAGWKVEDAVHTTGDVGIMGLGVRTPATPASITSAVGDYSPFAVDSEGKQLISGSGSPETAWQARVGLTTTSDVQLRAAPGAGIRTYVTDLVLENTSATATRVLIKDGATSILSVTLAGGSNLIIPLRTPLKLTANTILNAAPGTAVTDVTITVVGFISI
jgi:hypothetical protein